MCNPRHFPPSVEELDPRLVVRDANGQQLGYFYFEEEPGQRSAAKLLSNDEGVAFCRGGSATTRFYHPSRPRGDGMAACGAGAAGRADVTDRRFDPLR